MGPEEIVPVGTRGNGGIIMEKKKKPAKKKKKSGNLIKRAQKNFERDPRKKNFLRAKSYRLVKAKIHEQSS